MALKNIALVGALLMAASCNATEKEAQDPAWMSGFWQMTADEDDGPLGGVIEFRSDGTYVGYDGACNSLGEIGYHVHRGNIYVTNVIPGKGPVSVIFHPSQDQSTLTYTSPRTKNNAVYKRIAGNRCVVVGS